jgi:queuine tRNA-ribosyltransferase
LTDSGGYQVFSLSKMRKITDDGVKFSSHIDGNPIYFTPEIVIDVERGLGADMIMPLDECAPYPCDYKGAETSVRRTTLWAKRSREHFLKNQGVGPKQYLFGIIQGSIYKDLRERACKEILEIGFDGYAIGGVSVGETVKEMFEALSWVEPHLPEDKPRYFMGIGYPDQIVKAVGEGMDMFDCVLPTRFGRHGTAFTSEGRKILTNKEFKNDRAGIDPLCDCMVCKTYSRDYLCHLCRQEEMAGLRLVSYHNLYFYVNLMKQIRQAIDEDRYAEFQKQFLTRFGSELAETVNV